MTRQLHEDIKVFGKKLEESIGEAKEKIAVFAIKRLIQESPVWTGTYVKSFRVSTGAADTTFEAYVHGEQPFPPKMPSSAANALRWEKITMLVAKTGNTKPFATITVSNSLPYADKVEYVGWPEHGSPPHHVFSIAALEIAEFTRNLNLFMKQDR